MITVAQLQQILPANKEVAAWHKAIVAILPKYGIVTSKQVAAFLAQCGHESADFTVLEENLYYSAKQLQKTWPKRFNAKLAAEVAKQPRRIAEIAYGGRMGNSQPGDGYLFRGQGIIQLTGRENFMLFGQSLNINAEAAAEYVHTKQGAVEAAGWYWKRNNLNSWVAKDDIDGLSDAINIGRKTAKIGDAHGYPERLKRFNRALNVLEGVEDLEPVTVPTLAPKAPDVVAVPPDAPIMARPLRRGAKGDLVKKVQAALNVDADGSYGPITEAAVKIWQEANGAVATGALSKAQVETLIAAN